MSESEPNKRQILETANARLHEFTSDPLAAGQALVKEERMDEMEQWANGIGAHTERLASAHHTVSTQIRDGAQRGHYNEDMASKRLAGVGNQWRTGVKVDAEGDIEVHEHYPYSTDTPAGNWATYRSPKNIRK
ncbi:MAG: hypothetical protein QG553_615 [Patescibacteria group bacterium]|nr:hypothetical protein [Patescibacteria group bacterium]